jgi:hypothetical protein
MDPELRSMLSRHREELLRRALALAVSRASLDDLAARPLGERIDDLELLFEAAGGSSDPGGNHSRRPLDLQAELEHQVEAHRQDSRPFSIAVIAAGQARVGRLDHSAGQWRSSGPDGRAWFQALRDSAAPDDVVIDAGDGATAVVLPDHGAREAAMATERLTRTAWRALGELGPLAGAGIATYPDDGASGYEILAAAYDNLWRQADLATGESQQAEPLPELPAEDERPPAPVHPLRPL